MRQASTYVLGITALLLAGCASSNDEYLGQLRAAADKADATLIDAIISAEAQQAQGDAIRAALVVEDNGYFSVRALTTEQAFKYKLDLSAVLLSEESVSASSGPCAGSVSLVEALEVAEDEAGGEAVAVVPDDDVACAFEIQVLTPDRLWEVKVSKIGAVLESEESDETGVPDSD